MAKRYKRQRSLAASKRAKRRAALRGWVVRRKREAAEFRRRSKASRKGWRRRKARKEIERRAKAPATTKKGVLGEWLVTWSYHPAKGKTRVVDFMVIARSGPDAELFVVKAAAKGQDSNGADLTWLAAIPWDEITSTKMPGDEDGLSKKEIRAQGEGWVEVR